MQRLIKRGCWSSVRPRSPSGRLRGTGGSAYLIADVVLERDCFDPAQHHRAVLELADQIGERLRGESQIASRLSLTVRYADRSSTTRTSTLLEPTNHSPALATAALSPRAGLGLRRGTRLHDPRRPCCQLAGPIASSSLDPGDARARAAEPPQTVPVGASGRRLYVQPL
ncbi:hypothetical protein OG562_01640 [Streptomyces sp. NBC_01275]|uniref:DinB/UmuC family translesion DNA polymerase n=1 Tax=Streptomyces sp. NBC_01275 TaxID=2903807 RepID=UPI00224EE421|nr:hypothetical protein [Streptomyces sp. NBC_01275]MCX4759709.1 hypothetical protein [Streptomyces sp. NBC_01275]